MFKLPCHIMVYISACSVTDLDHILNTHHSRICNVLTGALTGRSSVHTVQKNKNKIHVANFDTAQYELVYWLSILIIECSRNGCQRSSHNDIICIFEVNVGIPLSLHTYTYFIDLFHPLKY